MTPVHRFICHFLIVWLALLSGGAHAHATADAAHELGHVAIHATEAHPDETHTAGTPHEHGHDHDHGHGESCSLSHGCHGHATGMVPAPHLRFGAADAAAPLATLHAWASREPANTIERPKWKFTTPSVVNL